MEIKKELASWTADLWLVSSRTAITLLFGIPALLGFMAGAIFFGLMYGWLYAEHQMSAQAKKRLKSQDKQGISGVA